ncbi:MAG: D-alanyl-D-alanine carboxypeptidase [Defluviitaleaceae bacterium]|nr:D-alanyl-D-alanine carboxypeptidase [Defluviitaleaceae bacterium]MCL2835887.1 D-alanyl-D-alanine carboxypeptidase [Defluviitaleaceae bacterium]
MFRKLSLTLFIIFISFIIFLPEPALAQEPPQVSAAAAVLVEAGTGKVLFGKEEHRRIFPASLTTILTAMVVLDYFDLDEVIVTGSEVRAVPDDSSKAGNVEGESITVHNLLRACIIISGNESASVLAMAVAKRVTGDSSIPYTAAERLFGELMNEKAREMGAFNSNFVNPHGYHHSNHYTTAYDMALISREAMKNDIIRALCAEVRWAGNGAGPDADPSWTTRNYNFTARNELIVPAGEFHYPFATGMKTGRHSAAGDTLAASAMKDGIELIAVISNSRDPGRWLDAVSLFEYGYGSYSHVILQEAGDVIGEITVRSPRRQDVEVMELLITDTVAGFLKQSELEGLVVDTFFLPEAIVDDPETIIALRTPVEEGQVLGRITYSAGGEILYTGDFIAAQSVGARTFATDIDYYWEIIESIFFTRQAVPYWIIAALSLIIISYAVYRIIKKYKAVTAFGRRW